MVEVLQTGEIWSGGVSSFVARLKRIVAARTNVVAFFRVRYSLTPSAGLVRNGFVFGAVLALYGTTPGISWSDILPGLTFRAAYFEEVKTVFVGSLAWMENVDFSTFYRTPFKAEVDFAVVDAGISWRFSGRGLMASLQVNHFAEFGVPLRGHCDRQTDTLPAPHAAYFHVFSVEQ